MSSTVYWIGLVSIFAFAFLFGKFAVQQAPQELAVIPSEGPRG